MDQHHVDADPDLDTRIRIGKNGSGSADPNREKTDPDPALCKFYFSFYVCPSLYFRFSKEVISIYYYKSNKKL